MSSMALARPILRQSGPFSRMAARRFESTATAKATEAAKETASKASSAASAYATKAAEGLSKVSSSAGPAIASAAQSVATSASKVGGRTGRFVGLLEKQVPQVLYYSRVGLELAKLVFQGQKMSPPSISTFQTYWQQVLKSVRNPGALLQTASQTASKATQQPTSYIQQARNLSRAQIVTGGVLLAELLGFFTVGEMIGRFKLIGYHGESSAAHH